MSNKVKSAFLSIDLFAHDPDDEEKKSKKKRRPTGSCCTLIIALAFSAYSLYSIEQFISNPSATSTPQLSEVVDNITIPVPTLVFAAPIVNSFIDGFPSMVVDGYISYGNGLGQHFPIKKCTTKDLPTSLQEVVVYCLGMDDLSIPGTYENSIVTGQELTITIYPRNCATFPSVQPFFVSILDPFEIDFTAGEFIPSTTFNLVTTLLTAYLSITATLPFEIEEYDISPDYLKRWQTHSQTKYTFQPLETEYLFTGGCNTEIPLITLQFVVSPQMTITSVSYPTILNLFSNLGALWTTALGIIAFIFLVPRKCKQKRLQKKEAGNIKTETSPEQALEQNSEKSPREDPENFLGGHADIKTEHSGIEHKMHMSSPQHHLKNKFVYPSAVNPTIDVPKV